MSPSRRVSTLFSAGLLLANLAAAGSDPFEAARPAIRSWNSGAVFTSATVYSPFKDSLGRIWFGTMTGPAYLEGQAMHEFPLPADAGTPRVRAIIETADRSLWFGTEGAGLWRYRAGAWTRYSKARGLAAAEVNSLLEVTQPDGSWALWVGTRSGAWRMTNERWESFGVSAGLPDAVVWKLRLVGDANGQAELWAATGRGVAAFRSGRWVDLSSSSKVLANRSVSDIAVVPASGGGRPEVWLSCWGVGLVHGDGTTWTVEGPDKGFTSRNPTELTVSSGRDGRPVLWAATYDRGLFWRGENGWHALESPRVLSASGVYGLLANPGRRPDVWIGTRGLGLESVDLSSWRTIDESDGLPSPEVNALAGNPADPSSIWIGTTRGLAHWNGEAWATIALPPDLKSDLVSNLAVERGPGGREVLWVGTPNGVALRDGGAWRSPGAADVVPRARVRAMLAVPGATGPGDIWIAFDGSLSARRAGRWTRATAGTGLPGDVTNMAATALPGGGYRLWAVLVNGEAWSLDGERWTRRMKGLDGHQVTGFDVLSVAGSAPSLWSGTREGALCRYGTPGDDDRWECHQVPASIPRTNRSIWTVAADAAGHLCLALTQSYLRVAVDPVTRRPAMGTAETFSLADGLPAYVRQSARSAPLLDGRGRVWLGTPRGVAVFDPSWAAPPPAIPGVRFVQAVADAASLPVNAPLSHGVKRLRFEFVLPYYDHPGDVTFRTQLRGLEEEPGPWQAESWREFAGLRSGSYVLEVTARDRAGRLSAPASFPFAIVPPPWQRWWAYLGYAAALLALAFGGARWHMRSLARDKRRLEHLVAERTEELRRRNEELAEARDRAMTATRAKSEFLANMSHEIRTPMNAILGFSGLALKLELPPVARDYFRKIAVSGHNLISVLNDILDFSKIEAGRLEFEHVPFDLPPLLAEITDLFALKSAEKPLSLLVTASPDVPATVAGDRVRLLQVLSNLVANAIKFTAAGFVVVRVERIEVSGGRALIGFSVEDSGIGLTPEQRARLFRAFTQADASTTRKYGGTGLGLTISKLLVEKMGGTISVSSDPGHGSVFGFTAPFDIVGNATFGTQVPDAVRGRHVLLVSPVERVLEALHAQLRAFGMKVTASPSLNHAIGVLAATPVDLVLADTSGAGPSGQGSVHAVLAESARHRVPVVVVVNPTDAGTALVGADGWTPLSAPIHPASLVHTIAAAVSGSAAGGSLAPPPPVGPSPDEERVRGLRVLLAEDNAINQDVAVQILRGAGVDVDVAATGIEAIQMVDATHYDAVLMDIQMPEMDGPEATEWIRRNGGHARLPIIAMTAHAMAGVREECLRAGMNDYVSKPIDPQALFAALARWSRGPAASDAAAAAWADRRDEDNGPAPDAPFEFERFVAQLLGDEAAGRRLIRKFIETRAGFVGELDKALSASDWIAAGRLAHSIKGVSGTLGAGALRTAAVELEREITAMKAAVDPGAAPETLLAAKTRFELEMEKMLAACRAVLAGEDAASPTGEPREAVPAPAEKG